jgi:hypothetical protein
MCQVLATFELLISSCYGPLLLGARFETYEPFISLILKFILVHGKLRMLNQQIQGHDCGGCQKNVYTFYIIMVAICSRMFTQKMALIK